MHYDVFVFQIRVGNFTKNLLPKQAALSSLLILVLIPIIIVVIVGKYSTSSTLFSLSVS